MRPVPHPCRLILALAFGMALGGCGAVPDEPGLPGAKTNAAEHLDAPYVVVLSIDGFRNDYLDRYPSPVFDRLMREGARAEGMIPGFPTKTFPTHYTIATGLHAEHHGLVGNRYWDPEREAYYSIGDRTTVEDGTWYRGEPIWVTAERQGMLSAAYYFVGTEADVGGVRPTYWHRYDASVTNDQRVDSVLAWLRLPPETRPHMITFYFSDLDDVGHAAGPDSPEAAEAVARVGASIGRLLDGLATLPHGDQVTVVVVSDHGMLRAEAARAQGLDLTPFPGVRMVEGGPYASLWIDEGGPDRGPALRDSIQAVLPHATVWLRQDVPERFHYSADPRIGDMVILADPGALVVYPDRVPTEDDFTHGWDNRIPEMAAIFLARGPGISGGQTIPAFESVHVYPFLAHLLGLTPAEVDGRLEVLAPILGGG